MVILPWILLTAISLAVVLWAEVRGRPAWNAAFKPVASLGFVCGAVAVGAANHPLGAPLLTALVLSWLGDVLLIPRHHKPSFLAGIASFLLAHVAYGWMFVAMGVDLAPLGVAFAVFVFVAVLVWRWLSPFVSGAMRPAVMAYIAVITTMVALSVGVTARSGSAVPVVAAVTFWLSDLTVARHRFVVQASVNRLVGLPLYYAAQFVFIALL